MSPPRNKDKIKILSAECLAQITCVVCHHIFYETPGYSDDERTGHLFECPKCKRPFQFKFSIEPLTKEEIIKQSIKDDLKWMS